ncbi:MAG TPA: hypothetical protein VNO50_02135 [Pyrinomonadaceae bacterium]|nr:hypothetical protein [Pyrinomonadaceae bacterium]
MKHLTRPAFAATLTFLLLILAAQDISAQTAIAGQIIISEFRVRGPGAGSDEFIELYNNSGADHEVIAASGTGYGVAASDGILRCSIPNGTIIPNRGHYLCVNSVAYSLASYPAGNGTTATGDATYTTDIPDNAGIALFNNNTGGASFSLANRLDAVGSTSEADTLYKEGTGYPALTPFSIDYSFNRKIAGTCTNAPNNCGLVTGSFPIPEGSVSTVQDTDNNSVDFIFVDTNGTSAGAGQRLGAPGPENLSSPTINDDFFIANLLDNTVGKHAAPNRQRDGGAFCAPPNPVVPPCVPAQNSTFGTISFRRRFLNATGLPVTRLRFRVVDQTTFPAVSGVADLRTRTSTATVIATINDPGTCGSKNPPEAAPCSVTVEGTTLESPPTQPNGSAYNSTMSVGVVTLATAIDPGASVNVQFVLGIQQMGLYRFYVQIEALTSNTPPITTPGVQFGSKNQKWTNWKAPNTGITDERLATPLAPASPGWFTVVPSRSSTGVNTSTKETAVNPVREESAKKPSVGKARRTPANLEASVPLTSEAPAPASVELPAASKSSVALPLVLNPAMLRGGAAGSSTTITVPAASAGAPKVVSAKERRRSRRAEMRARRKTTRRR